MFYFIPSWYNDYRVWYDNSNVFHQNYVNREFDDTIHQMKLFRKSKEDFKLFVLNYNPNLRYFLHRNNIYGINYISVFDIIQNIKDVNNKTIDLSDFIWDSDVEFVYTPFLIMVLKDNKKYANVNFSHNGSIMYIDFFENNIINKKYIMDDRGFLSSILYYSNGIEHYQDYLNTSGVWQIREYINISDNIIEVNKYADYNFKKESYSNIEEIILEIVNNIISSKDTIICSASNVNTSLLLNRIEIENIVFSFFEDRFDYNDVDMLNECIKKSKIVVTDTRSTYDSIINLINNENYKNKLRIITPYDTRLLLGKSQRVKELIIYLFSDMDDRIFLRNIILEIIMYMEKDKRVNLILGTYNKKIDEVSIRNIVDEILKNDFNDRYFIQEKDDSYSENKLDTIDEDRIPINIEIETIKTELDLIKKLEYTRLIIDLSDYPDILTSIIGISSGIPQINLFNNEYVDNYQNGIILDNFSDLSSSIDYYFKGLENWNKSLVYSVQKLLQYTSEQIVNEWKLLLKD